MLASFSSAAGIAAIKGNQVFGPYGNARDYQGTINTAKGYTGQYNDSLTGLDYYGSRYYDQVAGVFLSADVKQGNMQGMNPYAYVGGNPETKNDPTGQMPCAGPEGPCGWPKPSTGGINTNGPVSIDIVPHSSNPCTLDNCSVTLGGQPFSTNGPNGLKTSLKSRLAFLQAFYDIFASGYQVAELDFFNYLQFSGRLDKRGGYWDSVDYRVVADALLAAFDFLNHQAFQSATVRSWLAFMAHPTDNGWWVAHNGSINAGDHQARASGLYSKETPVEQVFINNAVHVINDIQFVSQINDGLAYALGPRSPATGILNKIFDPQQYNDGSDLAALSFQEWVATNVGGVVGFGAFLSTLFPT